MSAVSSSQELGPAPRGIEGQIADLELAKVITAVNIALPVLGEQINKGTHDNQAPKDTSPYYARPAPAQFAGMLDEVRG